jgi:hypothetical protein
LSLSLFPSPSQEKIDDDGDEATEKCKADQRPCPICRSPVGEKDLFPLEAFEPSEQAIADRVGEPMGIDEDDDDDDTLDGFIVNDDEDEDSDRPRSKNKNKIKAPSQPNRRVIQDSDDEDNNYQEASEAEESDSEARKKKAAKGKGKAAAAKHVRELWRADHPVSFPHSFSVSVGASGLPRDRY